MGPWSSGYRLSLFAVAKTLGKKYKSMNLFSFDGILFFS